LDFRLLRYFVAVADELHLARAAERVGIEQSPVSRAMRDLGSQLGLQLFDRSTRLTRLTWAGQVFLGECRRVMATVEQAVKSTKAAQGYQGHLRIAICDSLAQPRIVTLLARSREDEPEMEIRVFELPFAQQLKMLHDDLLDIGFALSNAVPGVRACSLTRARCDRVQPEAAPAGCRAAVRPARQRRCPAPRGRGHA
jgi:DNA-binding transcriptional LysR family regulator